MIKRFRHKGLEALYEGRGVAGVNPQHRSKLKRILARLDVASGPQDLNLPGWRLHQLSGNLNGHWSITVNANWRIIFRFSGIDITDVDYLDYH